MPKSSPSGTVALVLLASSTEIVMCSGDCRVSRCVIVGGGRSGA